MIRLGNWILTSSGRQFWPLDPWPEDVFIEDVAYSLANQSRFAGHCRPRYVVADHSLRVSAIVSKPNKLQALLHDAAEAYLVDLPSPVKYDFAFGPPYLRAEDRVHCAIFARFGLDPELSSEIRKADAVLLATEFRDLMDLTRIPSEFRAEMKLHDPLPERIVPRSEVQAERDFLDAFRALGGRYT